VLACRFLTIDLFASEPLFMLRIPVFLVTLLLPAIVMAAPQPQLLGFADSLAADGDHYRAITEYKRFIYEQPDSLLVPRARLSIAKSLLAGEQWRKSDAAFENLFLLHPASPETRSGRRLYADSAYERGAFDLARERYQNLRKKSDETNIINYANFRIGWTFLEQNRIDQARENFALLPVELQQPLAAELDQFEALPRKSAALAGTLSALLPGAGQAYTGRYRQAAVSFLLNAAFLLGAVEAFDNDNNTVGGILLFFELGWYGGNIYNAMNNAHKFNHRIRHDIKKQIRSRIDLQARLVRKTPVLALLYSF